MAKFELRLDYSHRDVTSLPEDLIQANTSVALLDVSNNQISDISFTKRFTNLNSLILDHNLVTAEAIFPVMPTLTTLWLNFNEINEMTPFISHLSHSFPNLRHLSMMGNKASPPCTEETFYNYVNYRLLVLSYMTNLEYLDDRAVTQDEREEARRLFGSAEEPSPSQAASISEYVFSLVDKVFDFIVPTPVTGRSSSFSERASVI
uniref:Leucine-rich repeat-containing protein C10orf11 n=1 Tax=Lygus hesperus TaxID=30085 RepID=A0A0A9YMJ8_LYGHE